MTLQETATRRTRLSREMALGPAASATRASSPASIATALRGLDHLSLHVLLVAALAPDPFPAADVIAAVAGENAQISAGAFGSRPTLDGQQLNATITAQSLYEGVEIPGEGPVGLITYMRTDSVNLSPEALSATRALIKRHYGAEFVPEKPRGYKTRTKGAQEGRRMKRPCTHFHVIRLRQHTPLVGPKLLQF